MDNSKDKDAIVLIVEDEPAIALACSRVFQREGYRVEIAVNGRIAKAMIAEKVYQMLVIDIRTPEMNGVDLYQYVTENHPYLARRVVFTTGDLFDEDRSDFLRRTGQPFLPKPFSLDELKAVLHRAEEKIKSDE